VKLDPTIHKDMHSVLTLKLGVTMGLVKNSSTEVVEEDIDMGKGNLVMVPIRSK
jgi:hypothetical protein